MEIFVCPKDWTFAQSRFTPDHMVSLLNPGTEDEEVLSLRPPWVAPENHHVSFFYDADILDPGFKQGMAPTHDEIKTVIDWLLPRCGPSSESRFLIHCEAGLGRSPAVGYIAWAIHLGVGREEEAFEKMKESCHETKLVPNTVIVTLADEILQRGGAMMKPLTAWNRRVTWRRNFGSRLSPGPKHSRG